MKLTRDELRTDQVSISRMVCAVCHPKKTIFRQMSRASCFFGGAQADWIKAYSPYRYSTIVGTCPNGEQKWVSYLTYGNYHIARTIYGIRRSELLSHNYLSTPTRILQTFACRTRSQGNIVYCLGRNAFSLIRQFHWCADIIIIRKNGFSMLNKQNHHALP